MTFSYCYLFYGFPLRFLHDGTERTVFLLPNPYNK